MGSVDSLLNQLSVNHKGKCNNCPLHEGKEMCIHINILKDNATLKLTLSFFFF